MIRRLPRSTLFPYTTALPIYLGFNIEQSVEFDSCFGFTELCPPKDTQTQVDCCGIKSIHFPFNFKIFDYPFLSSNANHMICKVFKYFRISFFVGFRKIASGNTFAKAKMVRLVGMCRNSICQVTKTVSVRQLTEHHNKQLIPTAEMFYVFIAFVFHNKSLKILLREKLDKLSENVFATKHSIHFFDNGCKNSNSNRGHLFSLVNIIVSMLYLLNLKV